MQKVKDHEQENIIRLSNEFKEELGITTTGTVAKETIKNQVKRKRLKQWKGKPLHNYLFKKIEEQQEIDQRATSEWMNTGLSSHLEGYAAALQEQKIAPELPSREERKTRQYQRNAGSVRTKTKIYSMS